MNSSNFIEFKKLINPDDSELARHARSGELDGGREYPATNAQEFGDYEKQIIYEGKTGWMKYKSHIEQYKIELKSSIDKVQNELDGELLNMNSFLADKHEKALQILEEEQGRLSAEYQHIEAVAMAAKEEKIKIEQLLRRPLQVEYVEYYVMALILLAIAEVPINRLAFELFFESMPLISLAIAAAIGGLLIFFAHTIGVMLKRTQCKEMEINNDSIHLTIMLLTILTIAIMYFLGLMREKWVEVNDAAGLNLEVLINVAISTDKAFIDSFMLGSKGVTLLLLNLGIFTVGVLLSFLRHDSHPQYEKVCKFYIRSMDKFMNIKRKYETRKSEIIKNYNKISDEKNNQIKSLGEQIKYSVIEFDGIDAKLFAEKNQLISSLARKIMAYQHSNQKKRKTVVPEYFKIDAQLLVGKII